jgi:regulator of sigma E protease
MITGRLSFFESTSGPIGISYITFKVVGMGLIATLHLIAVLSVSLAIFNFLPFPILDGGHILFLGIEKIRGRVLSLKTERIITHVGLTFIITLVIIVSYNDILRFFGDKISKFIK